MKLILTVLAALLVVSVLVLSRVDARRMPQVVSGEDALSVAFGDAKATIGRALLQKADSYFHGGIGDDNACLARRAPCDDHDHSSSDAHHASLFTLHFLSDPWQWIDRGIRAPDQHRHLQGAEAVEMLPWLWASVKADPHNEEVWESAWYTAAHVMKDEALAVRILEEGLARNPKSARLHLTKGEFLYKRGKGDLSAAERCFRQAIVLAPADSQICEFANRYLKDLEKHRGK